MDVLSDLLRRSQAAGSVFALATLRAPWGIELDDALPVTVHVAIDGPVWIRADGADPCELAAGDLAVVPAGRRHRVCSDPWARTMTLDAARRHLVPGTLATFDVPGPGAASTLLCGAYRIDGALCTQLVDAMPSLTVIRADDPQALPVELVRVLVSEITGELPGRSVVLDRLLDVVVVHAMRRWLDAAGPDAPDWHRALRDPEIGRALGLVHADPGAPWTVASWARQVGMSRATFARRFDEAMGTAPMAYLTRWRMRLATEQLGSSDLAVARIARSVGYRSDAAFTAAFRRETGTTPTAYRRAAGTAVAG